MQSDHLRVGVGIFGTGAVGHLLAFLTFQQAKLAVVMWGRDGLAKEAKDFIYHEHRYQIELSEPQQVDIKLYFVAVKSYALASCLQQYLPTIPRGSRVIILGNGYLEEELKTIRQSLADYHLVKGMVTWGIRWDQSGAYRLSGQGEIYWGHQQERQAVEDLLFDKLSTFGLRWSEQICTLRKVKWFFNTTLNSLCGYYHLAKNADALSFHEQELSQLATEVYVLAGELWPGELPSFAELWRQLVKLIEKTAENENSMAADRRLHRKTEHAHLSGLVYFAKDPENYPLLTKIHAALNSGANEVLGKTD